MGHPLLGPCLLLPETSLRQDSSSQESCTNRVSAKLRKRRFPQNQSGKRPGARARV